MNSKKLELSSEDVNKIVQKFLTREHFLRHQRIYKVEGKGAWVLYLNGEGKELPFLTAKHLFYVPTSALPCIGYDQNVMAFLANIQSADDICIFIINACSWCKVEKNSANFGTDYLFWGNKFTVAMDQKHDVH